MLLVDLYKICAKLFDLASLSWPGICMQHALECPRTVMVASTRAAQAARADSSFELPKQPAQPCERYVPANVLAVEDSYLLPWRRNVYDHLRRITNKAVDIGSGMDESIARIIRSISNWADLRQFEQNARQRDRLTPEIERALARRSFELGRELIEQRTGLDLTNLLPVEEKIVDAVSRYVAIQTTAGKQTPYTFRQLKNRGLIGTAEAAVVRSKPTQGFQTLVDEDEEDASFEQVVVDFPEQFSARAQWFARRALGLPTLSATAPAEDDEPTQTRTHALLLWLKEAAKSNEGVLPSFNNQDAADAMGISDMAKNGRHHGNIQSRIDFACFQCNLPALGLAADAPFREGWQSGDRDWAFPVDRMQAAAQAHVWTDDEFDQILRVTEQLPGRASPLWTTADESAVKTWAFGPDGMSLQDRRADDATDESAAAEPGVQRNPKWVRDELILALDLYMRNRTAPLGKDASEIAELSEILNALGLALGQKEGGTYRNPAGVYMKLMNFRRFDPTHTAEGKVGLQRGNKDEEVVWNQFAGDPIKLRAVAQLIRQGIKLEGTDGNLSGPDDPSMHEAEEGKLVTRMHSYRERDRGLVDKAKAAALKKYGRLRCEACELNFADKYGVLGEGLIDVHHTKPVHTLQPGETTKVSDLALLCANCHRVVHSRRKWFTVDEVRAAVRTSE